MKTTIYLFFNFLVFCSFTQQTSYTCYEKQNCEYNAVKKTFENCEKIIESSSFTINNQETIISHVSFKHQNIFYINEKSYDEKNNVYNYDSYDENGNWFMIYIDLTKKEIRLLNLSFPPVAKCFTIYKIKAVF